MSHLFANKRIYYFYGERVNVPEYREKHHLSPEAAARELRYRVFAKAMAAYHADVLALGHHGDDQIETMLMRQVRGSFGISRAGIPVKRDFAAGQIIRPFLTQTKAEIAAYCRDQGIESRHDETNNSEKFTRNRFRKHVLPFLKQENPRVHLRFQYESERIAEDEQLLIQLAKERMDKVVLKKETDEVILSLPFI
ncbi:tRNA lysidine(34) synthetase TilS [Terrilactibacillus sp. S3-3]|nr:tRNA lysidine(34) synthetase TilS [Terrilactibacillus sp. S3-3]